MNTLFNKICSNCKQNKSCVEYYSDKSKLDGLGTICKKCVLLAQKIYRSKNKEKIFKRKQKYRENNKDKIKTLWQEWYQKNKEYCIEHARQYRETNKQRIKEYRSLYGVQNKNKIIMRKKIYRENHKEEINTKNRKYQKTNKEKRNIYLKEKRKNIKTKLEHNLSCSIRQALRKNKGGHYWEELVDYNIEKLMNHLEKQFKGGMTWNNYGKWHIDHKIPQSVFNFSKPEHIDFKKCWALNNLQPMWAKDNLTKYIKLDRAFQPSLAIG